MENAVIERVNIVVRSKRFTKKALASTLGIGESLLGKKLNGSITMDLATIIGILELFNDIDANWLLLGRGAMCIDGKECIGKLDVRKIRMSLSQSLTEFAKNVGVDRSQLSLIESGKRKQLSTSITARRICFVSQIGGLRIRSLVSR